MHAHVPCTKACTFITDIHLGPRLVYACPVSCCVDYMLSFCVSVSALSSLTFSPTPACLCGGRDGALLCSSSPTQCRPSAHWLTCASKPRAMALPSSWPHVAIMSVAHAQKWWRRASQQSGCGATLPSRQPEIHRAVVAVRSRVVRVDIEHTFSYCG